jgi:osmoprotectant transport system ATP-binding protein
VTQENSAHAEGRSPNSTAAPLEFDEVSKRYTGADEAAIESLSLEVPAGDILVLVGPSGCGKTTAMRMVNRMIDITSGDIRLDGESITKRNPSELRREIGYVIQQIGLFPHQTIAENIATVPKLLGWDSKRISARVEELIDLVSLPQEMGKRYPSQLSGGQRQRIGVARALAADPPLMLMDEPFGAIDPITRERLQNEFLRLQADIRKTIVFVTHDIDEAIKMGDRIAVLKKGGVLAQYATPTELLMDPADEFVEDFVGADRALKRLALMRVREIDLWKAPIARVGEPTAEAKAKIASSDLRHILLVDDANKPLRWVPERELDREKIERGGDGRPKLVTLDEDAILRDALADLLASDTQYGPVVDSGGQITGVLSVEIISQFLAGDQRTVAEAESEAKA